MASKGQSWQLEYSLKSLKGGGTIRKPVALVLVDRSRYTAAKLREIRADGGHR